MKRKPKSFFLAVSLAMKEKRLDFCESETHEYFDLSVVMWKLNHKHTMVLVRKGRVFQEFKLYPYHINTIRKWYHADKLYLLYKYTVKQGDSYVVDGNQTESKVSQYPQIAPEDCRSGRQEGAIVS